jgi:hypothetical protein
MGKFETNLKIYNKKNIFFEIQVLNSFIQLG